MLILMNIYFLPMQAIFGSIHKWLAGSFHNVYILKNRSTNFTHIAMLHCQKPVFCVDERKIMANKMFMYIYICEKNRPSHKRNPVFYCVVFRKECNRKIY